MTDTIIDESLETLIRQALPHLADGTIEPDLDLGAQGLDSMAAVQLLLDIEETFAVNIPDDQLSRDLFATPARLWAAISRLRSEGGDK